MTDEGQRNKRNIDACREEGNEAEKAKVKKIERNEVLSDRE